MPQPMVRRIALRALQAALAGAGIFVIMLLFSRPADAATAALPPLTSTQTTAGSTAAGVGSGADPIASARPSAPGSTVAPVTRSSSGGPTPVTTAAAPVV